MAHVRLVHGEAVILDLVVAHIGEAGLVHIHADRHGAALMRDLSRDDGLTRAAQGHGDDQGILVHIRRGGVHELVARVTGGDNLGRLVLHEVLGRIVPAVGSACTDPHHARDAAGILLALENLRDDVLHLLLLGHARSPFFGMYDTS